MKTLQTIAAGVLVLGMGSAFAGEPVALNEAQMDKVSAGFAAAGSTADATADYGFTYTHTTARASGSDSYFWLPVSVDRASTSSTASAFGVNPSSHSSSWAFAY